MFQVSLSKNAELALEETIQAKAKGDVIYYWAHLDVDGGFTGNNDALTFWSMCDILNGGNCRYYVVYSGFEQTDLFQHYSFLLALSPSLVGG